MLPLNGEGAPRCVNSRDAQGIVELASATVPHKTDHSETQVAPIRAALFGSDQCSAEDCTLRAASTRNSRAASAAIAVIQIMKTAPHQQRRQQVEQYLADEFKDERRQAVADRELADA